MQGDLAGAAAAMASIDDLFTEGFDAWARATGRAYIDYTAGNSEAVLRGLQPDAVGAAAPKDSDLVIETEMLRADALAWSGDIEGARRAVDRGEAAVAAEHYRGRAGTVAWRWSARAEAVPSRRWRVSRSVRSRRAEARGRDRRGVGDRRRAARGQVRSSTRTMGIDAEVGRLRQKRSSPVHTARRSLRDDRVAVLRGVLPLARGGGDVGRR
jgi:hypothetical protein